MALFFNSQLLRFKQAFLNYYDQRVHIKKPVEIGAIRKACKITADIYEAILDKDLKPGVREKEIAERIVHYAEKMGADKKLAFSSIIGSGPNSSFIHSTPTSRKVKEGDVVQFDFGVRVDGYCSDMSRAIFMGKKKDAPEKVKKMMKLVKQLQQEGLDNLKKHLSLQAIGQATWDAFKDKGLHYNYMHSLGHGVGIEIHEFPRIAPSTDKMLLPKPGMVVTIEPGVYFPGKFGCRIEDTVLVTAEGIDVLTPATKKLWFK